MDYKALKAIALATDNLFWWTTWKELRHLPKILEPEETPSAITSGYVNGRTWLIAITNRRIIFLDKGWLYRVDLVSMDIGKINAVASNQGLMYGTVAISDSAGTTQIEQVYKPSAALFAKAVQTELDKRDQPAAGPVPSKYDELAKLSALYKTGALTQREFELEKQKLLLR